MSNCFYCEQGKTLEDLMIPVCELEHTLVYLVKNQNYPGRSVVLYKQHIHEMFELSEVERCGYFNELSQVAKALSELYNADKINYGIFGDMVPHLHCHVAPKCKDSYGWGAPFAPSGNDTFPPMEELEQTAEAIRKKLGVSEEEA